MKDPFENIRRGCEDSKSTRNNGQFWELCQIWKWYTGGIIDNTNILIH